MDIRYTIRFNMPSFILNIFCFTLLLVSGCGPRVVFVEGPAESGVISPEQAAALKPHTSNMNRASEQLRLARQEWNEAILREADQACRAGMTNETEALSLMIERTADATEKFRQATREFSNRLQSMGNSLSPTPLDKETIQTSDLLLERNFEKKRDELLLETFRAVRNAEP